LSSLRFYSTVKKLEEKKRIVSGRKISDDEVKLETENLGWFLLLDGSWEAIYAGDTQPDFRVGQRVEVTIKGL